MSNLVPAGRRPRILIVGGRISQLQKARDLGLEVVYAQYPDAYDREYGSYVDQALLLDYADVDQLLPLVQAVHKANPLNAVMTRTEIGLLPVAHVSQALGLGAESVATTELLLDKARMREHLAASGVSPVAFAVGRSAQDVREFVEAHGFPIIVKPIRESGSLAVFRVQDEADMAEVAERYLSLNDKDWGPGDVAFADTFEAFLMEEFLEGPEISVETLSFQGRHVVVAVTDHEFGGTGFAEIGLSQPSSHPADVVQEATRLVTDMLTAVGLRNGPGHTEVKLTPRGPRIVESHNRIGGYAINEMAEVAYGVDMERYAVEAGVGLLEPLTGPPEPRCAVALQALLPEPGTVVEVTGADAVRADPAFVLLQVQVKPGDVVEPLTWNQNIGGFVVARGDSVAEAVAHARRLAQAVCVRTEPTQ